jgi:pimeloyl-ACP methyl ester carboxylesterase
MQAYIAGLEKKLGPLPPAAKDQVASSDLYALAAIAESHSHPAGPEPDEIMGRFNLPTLIFAGESDPVLEAARYCANRINASFFSLPGLNHNKCFEHSDLVLPYVKKFLAEVNNKIGER